MYTAPLAVQETAHSLFYFTAFFKPSSPNLYSVSGKMLSNNFPEFSNLLFWRKQNTLSVICEQMTVDISHIANVVLLTSS